MDWGTDAAGWSPSYSSSTGDHSQGGGSAPYPTYPSADAGVAPDDAGRQSNNGPLSPTGDAPVALDGAFVNAPVDARFEAADASYDAPATDRDAPVPSSSDSSLTLQTIEPEGGLVPPPDNADASSHNAPDDAALPGATDTATTPDDSATADADALPAMPLPGEILVTEIMFDPSGPVPGSEWFEIYNAADTPRLLSGLTIQDGEGRTHVIGSDPPVIAPAATFVLLVRDGATASSNLVPASAIVYAYGAGLADDQGIELAAGPGSELSLWNGAALIADVPYGAWSLAAPGQSIELATGLGPPDIATSWCVASWPWTDGSDWGTPGAASDCP